MTGSYMRLRSGNWGVRVTSPAPEVKPGHTWRQGVQKKSGESAEVTVQCVWRGQTRDGDEIAICAMADASGHFRPEDTAPASGGGAGGAGSGPNPHTQAVVILGRKRADELYGAINAAVTDVILRWKEQDADAPAPPPPVARPQPRAAPSPPPAEVYDDDDIPF